MRPIYIFAGLAVLFVLYTEQQQQQLLAQQQWLGQYNLSKAQMALNAANTPAGLITSIVGGVNSIAGLAGFGLD